MLARRAFTETGPCAHDSHYTDDPPGALCTVFPNGYFLRQISTCRG